MQQKLKVQFYPWLLINEGLVEQQKKCYLSTNISRFMENGYEKRKLEHNFWGFIFMNFYSILYPQTFIRNTSRTPEGNPNPFCLTCLNVWLYTELCDTFLNSAQQLDSPIYLKALFSGKYSHKIVCWDHVQVLIQNFVFLHQIFGNHWTCSHT